MAGEDKQWGHKEAGISGWRGGYQLLRGGDCQSPARFAFALRRRTANFSSEPLNVQRWESREGRCNSDHVLDRGGLKNDGERRRMLKIEGLIQRFQALLAASSSRPGCFTLLVAVSLSFLMYPVLRTIGLQVHSALTGSYISGTHSVAFVNCPNEQIARDIARYIWKGEIEEATEILLLVKTKTSKIRELSDYIRSIHPFEAPEIISLLIDQGNPAYLKWIEESVPYG